ncbi:MAG: hypothetical protein ACREEP_04885 [Dongiaceae bacterium]
MPENRFDAHIGNIATMMTPGATTLIRFLEAAERRRQTGLAWATPRAQFAAAARHASPQIACEFDAVVEGEVDGIRQSYAILTLAA